MKQGTQAAGRLTERQRRFAAEYARSGDPTQAAIRAGYREKGARSTGLRLLRLPEIQAARQSPSREALEQQVLDRLRSLALDDADGTRKPQEQLRALELLMKHLGMLDRTKQSEDTGVEVVLAPQLALWAK